MAGGAAVSAYPSTLAVAATAETATLSGDYTSVEVVSRPNGNLPADEIWFTVDGAGGPSANGTPTVGGKDCYYCQAGGAVIVPSPKAQGSTVTLISATQTGYIVQGVSG